MDTTSNWDDWRLVHAAHAHGSFTAAAAALGLGQATLSRRIARAEERLGHRLFDRHRTGLVPTPALRALLPHLEAMASATLGADLAADGLEAEASGVVRVAAPPGMCADWLPRVALRLRESHPRVTLEVLADIRARDLDRREADLAVRAMPTLRGDLLARKVLTVTGGLYGAPALVATLPARPDPATLPVVGWSTELADIPLARFLDQLFPEPVLRTNDYLVLRAAVVAGVGVSLFGHDEAAHLGLVPVDVPLPVAAGMDVYVVVHRALRHVPRVAAVLEAVDAVVAEAAERSPVSGQRSAVSSQ
ncbi:MAG: LysR family transcriptional regulator, partial [Myxococcales bacterium]|nr:LysR family transcriptional regulator [Myxococcales bacterium]